MKTDLYTKIVLTVIAVALTGNLCKELITPAMAAETKPYAMVPVNADGSINVTVKKMPMETLDVNLRQVGGDLVSRPLSVKIQDY